MAYRIFMLLLVAAAIGAIVSFGMAIRTGDWRWLLITAPCFFSIRALFR